MNIAFHVPVWLLWTLGGLVALVVLTLALFGWMFLRSMPTGGYF